MDAFSIAVKHSEEASASDVTSPSATGAVAETQIATCCHCQMAVSSWARWGIIAAGQSHVVVHCEKCYLACEEDHASSLNPKEWRCRGFGPVLKTRNFSESMQGSIGPEGNVGPRGNGGYPFSLLPSKLPDISSYASPHATCCHCGTMMSETLLQASSSFSSSIGRYYLPGHCAACNHNCQKDRGHNPQWRCRGSGPIETTNAANFEQVIANYPVACLGCKRFLDGILAYCDRCSRGTHPSARTMSSTLVWGYELGLICQECDTLVDADNNKPAYISLDSRSKLRHSGHTFTTINDIDLAVGVSVDHGLESRQESRQFGSGSSSAVWTTSSSSSASAYGLRDPQQQPQQQQRQQPLPPSSLPNPTLAFDTPTFARYLFDLLHSESNSSSALNLGTSSSHSVSSSSSSSSSSNSSRPQSSSPDMLRALNPYTDQLLYIVNMLGLRDDVTTARVANQLLHSFNGDATRVVSRVLEMRDKHLSALNPPAFLTRANSLASGHAASSSSSSDYKVDEQDDDHDANDECKKNNEEQQLQDDDNPPRWSKVEYEINLPDETAASSFRITSYGICDLCGDPDNEFYCLISRGGRVVTDMAVVPRADFARFCKSYVVCGGCIAQVQYFYGGWQQQKPVSLTAGVVVSANGSSSSNRSSSIDEKGVAPMVLEDEDETTPARASAGTASAGAPVTVVPVVAIPSSSPQQPEQQQQRVEFLAWIEPILGSKDEAMVRLMLSTDPWKAYTLPDDNMHPGNPPTCIQKAAPLHKVIYQIIDVVDESGDRVVFRPPECIVAHFILQLMRARYATGSANFDEDQNEEDDADWAAARSADEGDLSAVV